MKFGKIGFGLAVVLSFAGLSDSMTARSFAADPTSGGARPYTIYGEDSRKNLYEITDTQTLKLADATVGLFTTQDGSDAGNGMIRIKASNYGTSEHLCSTEKFLNENEGAWCSGTLIAPNVVITAGHCIKNASDCGTTSFAFGYSYTQPSDDPELRPAGEVYKCAKVLNQVFDPSGRGTDYSIVELDREVTGHTPVPMGRSRNLKDGTPLIVIGHPSGLPTKVADGSVRANSAAPYYVTNLDTFAGNSGSGVFDPARGTLIGVLVRGDTDFTFNSAKQCSTAFINPENGGRGEDVTKLNAAVTKQIKAAVNTAKADLSVAPTH